jgi:hypothetical protein
VELLVPVRDPACRATLDRLLALYRDDATAWELRPDGGWVPRGGATGAQASLLDEGAREREGAGAGG